MTKEEKYFARNKKTKKYKEAIHTSDELKQLQALPLETKIKKAQLRIREAVDTYGEDGLYVSFSGGKDSQVLLDIVRKMGLHIEVVWCNTGLEDRGTNEIATRERERELRPELTFAEVITKYGYPFISKEVAQTIYFYKRAVKKGIEQPQWIKDRLLTGYWEGSSYDFRRYKYLIDAPFRISNKCCEVNKEKPLRKYEKESGKIPMIAMLASESKRRKASWLYAGCNAFNTTNPSSRPLMIWTEKDILTYIKDNDIKIAEEYGDVIIERDLLGNTTNAKTTGANRTGCIFCGFGIGLERDRFLRYKEKIPKIYDYIMRGGKFDEEGMWIPHEGLGYKFVIDWLNENGEMFKKKPILY